MNQYRLIHGDAIESLRGLPTGVAHALCTSVPFWLQRNYKKKGSHGREETREHWAAGQVDVMHEAKRVLRKDATAFVVVGETYTTRRSGDDLKLSEASLQAPYLAERLREDGWWIKAIVILEFDNPTPSSPTDRPRQVHQYGILLAQSPDYFWDYISSKTPGLDYDVLLRSVWSGPRENAYRSKRIKFKHTSVYPRWVPDRFLKAAVSEGGVCSRCGAPWLPKIVSSKGGSKGKSWHDHQDDSFRGNAKKTSSKDYVPAKIVGWKPGCSCGAERERPLVIDPFAGTSTTGVSALSLECRFLGIDLDPRCVRLSEERLREHVKTLSTPLFDSAKAGRRQRELFNE